MLAVCHELILPVVRLLTADDTATYRALRKTILATGDGRYFSDSYTREAKLNDDQWLAWCTETPEHCIFGIFDENCLIGVMMITRRGVRDDRAVEWEAIWLDPSYRKQGIAKLAYEQIQRWTLDQGYDHVILYIRADNFRSLEIHGKHGAHYVYTKSAEIWADGSVADAHAFIVNLQASASNRRKQQTLRHLEATLESIRDEVPSIEEIIQDKVASTVGKK